MADLTTSEQLRAARAMLLMAPEALSQASRLPLATIQRLEGARGAMSVDESTLEALQRALEAAGVEFTDDGGPGVRMKADAASISIDELNATNDE
jgi:hypothetical protein